MFKTRTIVVSLLVGIIITMIAALRPALRATRVPPIAAVREGALLPPSRLAQVRHARGRATIIGAVALMLIGLFVSGLSTGIAAARDRRRRGRRCSSASRCSRRSSCRRSCRCSAGRRRRSAAPRASSREGNSMRNPARTASTASALMIGLALVTLVAVLAAGLRTGFKNSVNKASSPTTRSPPPTTSRRSACRPTQAVRSVPGVTGVVGVRAGDGKAFGVAHQRHAAFPRTSAR